MLQIKIMKLDYLYKYARITQCIYLELVFVYKDLSLNSNITHLYNYNDIDTPQLLHIRAVPTFFN